MNSRSTKYILPVVMGGLWILAAPSLSWAQKADSKPAQSAPVEEAAIETPMMMQKTETTTAPTENTLTNKSRSSNEAIVDLSIIQSILSEISSESWLHCTIDCTPPRSRDAELFLPVFD